MDVNTPYDLGPIFTAIPNEDILAMINGEDKSGLKVLNTTGLNFLLKNLDFSSSGGGGASGFIIKAEDIGGTSAQDDTVSTKVISTTATSTASEVASAVIENIPLGSYSIVTRMQVSAITNTTNFMKFDVYSVAPDNTQTLLKTVNVKSTVFSKVDTWESLSFGVNFTGLRDSKLKIVLTSLANSATPVVNYMIDYISILQSGTALGSIG